MNRPADPIEDDEGRDPLDALGEEFLERLRRGERPSVRAYAGRDPKRAAEIREFLEALLMIEGLKPQADETVVSARNGEPGPEPLAEQLGDFHIIRELGRGGMGIVYEAEQASLGRRVALKVLTPGLARTEPQVHRFVREARAAARLHHTNIVPVFGVGEDKGLHYYAMQFIPGLGLDKVLDEVRRLKTGVGPMAGAEAPSTPRDSTDLLGWPGSTDATPPWPEGSSSATPPDPRAPSPLTVQANSTARYARGVARIGLQVAEAIAYAHQQGTLHRDVKPSNILLDVHNVAWVTDFGLAKAAEDDDLTRTGDVVGTLRYMAPERFCGRCDERADVYGLGLVLYELLALRPAFDASNREGLLYQVTRVEPPSLSSVNPDVPRDLATIVQKSIEKDAADRYPTAAALADDLRRFLDDAPIVARPLRATERLSRWARRNPGLATLGTALAGMLALVVALITTAELRLRREHGETLFHLHRAENAETYARNRLLDSSVEHARASRRSRVAGRRFDGLRALAEAAILDPQGRRRLELRNEAIACLALADIRPLVPWSGHPDDGYVGLDFDPITGRSARGTPDGAVVFRDPDGLAQPGLAALPGNGLRSVMLRFSPDGRHLAVKHERGGRIVLVVWDLQRQRKVLDLPDGMYANAVDFHPSEPLVATGRRDGAIVLLDLADGRERRRLPPGSVPRLLRFDPSGRRLAVVSPNSREGVQVRNVDDGALVASWTRSEPEYGLAWHPDGDRLAVGSEGGRIRLLEVDHPAAAQRIFGGHDGQVVSVAFHPGGTLLASASWDGTIRLWDSRTGDELVKAPLPETRDIRFSRDGRRLGPGYDTGTSWLWEVDEGNECRSLVGRDGNGSGTWSVDFLDAGRVVITAGSAGVRLEPADGTGRAAFIDIPGMVDAAAMPDGRAILTSGSAGLLRWPVRRAGDDHLTVGPPVPVGPIPGIPTGRIQLARDGRTLAVVIDDEVGRVLVVDLDGRVDPVELSEHPNMERVDISPDGSWAATGTWHGKLVKLWDVRGGQFSRDLPIAGNAEVLFRPDGQQLLTASGTEYAFWDVPGWTERLRLPRSHTSGLPGVAAFSPDGRHLALARTRSVVELVDASTGRGLATLESPDSRNIAGLGFSPDGQHLVVTFSAARLQVWDLLALRRGLAQLGLDWSERPPGPVDVPPAPAASTRLTIDVAMPPWLSAMERGEVMARAGRRDEAVSAFEAACAGDAPVLDAWMRRILFLLARGDAAGYRAACRDLVRRFDPGRMHLRTVNDLIWSCALGPGAVDDYETLIRHERRSASSRPEPNRLNTLGALLYRAGRYEEAVRQLDHAVRVHGAGGTQYDAIFLAMAHHRLGHDGPARQWYERATAAAPAALQKPDAPGDTTWIPRVELQLLSEEAATTLGMSPR